VTERIAAAAVRAKGRFNDAGSCGLCLRPVVIVTSWA